MEATRGPFEASDGLQRPSEGPSEGNRGSLRRPEALRENAGVTRPGLHQRSGSYAQFWLSVACRRVPSCRKKTMWWHPRPRPPSAGQGPSNQGCGGVEISDGSGSGSGEKKIGFGSGSGSGSGFDSSTQFILYTNKYGWKRKDEGLVHVVSVFA